jgi:hypothetical protein
VARQRGRRAHLGVGRARGRRRARRRRIEYSVDFHNLLTAGRYYVGCAVTRGSAGLEALLVQERATDMVSYGQDLHSLVYIYHEQSVTRALAKTPVP